MKEGITTIILTKNEEKNIRFAIESARQISTRILVIDCGSEDQTVKIAEELGAEVYYHEWQSHARQFNWALDNCNIDTTWVFRLDADERVTEASANEIIELCKKNEKTEINGIIVRFAVTFLDHELHYGGIYPIRVLRLFKFGIGYIEDRSMDEHTLLRQGKSIEMKNDLKHHDFKLLREWIEKHNKYSDKEVEEYYKGKRMNTTYNTYSHFVKIKRFLKNNIYYKLPFGFRAYIYYMYRYYFQLGFLDGKEGKIFCFLQAYWYRFLVDAKIYEHDLRNRTNESSY